MSLRETSTVSKVSATEYNVAVNDYGQTYSNVGVAKLSCETNAQAEDIADIEFYTPKGYSGKYVLQAGANLMDAWNLHADNVTSVDEDVTVVMKVTFKNGQVAYDHATFKIRNEAIYFKNDPTLTVEEDYGVTKDDQGVYHTNEDNRYSGIGAFDLGVSTFVTRINNSLEFTSSDESVLTVAAAGVHQQTVSAPRKFYITFKAAGVAVITAKATDDSGIEVTRTITFVVEPAQDGE